MGLFVIAMLAQGGWARPRPRVRIMRMEATAYVETANPTAAGTLPHEGIVAADPAVLPLNSQIRVSGAGAYNGVYKVRDTGSKVVGRHVDLCLPSRAEARQFGKKVVTVRVLKIGNNKPVTTAATTGR